MAKPRYLRTVRLLAECYHAFERLSGRHVRELGLTPPQFDVIATLGNTAGMTAGDLSARTLITKGTLTGVLDRLERAGLLSRCIGSGDRRTQHVRLTAAGEQVFERVFPAHVAHCQHAFVGIDDGTLASMESVLAQLRDRFEGAGDPAPNQDKPFKP